MLIGLAPLHSVPSQLCVGSGTISISLKMQRQLCNVHGISVGYVWLRNAGVLVIELKVEMVHPQGTARQTGMTSLHLHDADRSRRYAASNFTVL